MKFFQFNQFEDFGQEAHLYILKGRERAFFQLVVDIPIYPNKPYVSIQLGLTSGLNFTLDLGIIFISKTFFGKHFD